MPFESFAIFSQARSILSEARKAVPALDYALGAAGIAAAAAIATFLIGKDRASLILLSSAFVGIVSLLIFASMVSSRSRSTKIAGAVLIRSVLALFVVFLGFTISAAAWNQPCNWSLVLGFTPSCKSTAVADRWLIIRGVRLFGSQDRPQIRVVASVNGSTFSYPGRQDIEWLEVGPSMVHQSFHLARQEQYDISFALYLERSSEAWRRPTALWQPRSR